MGLGEKESGTTSLRREPRYSALVRDLRERMQSGQLQPGDRLPSFNELRERWGIGRETLEQAYATLERDGLIVREPRRGVFVSRPGQPKRTGVIGFAVATSLQSHPYYMHLLEGVRRGADLADMEVLLLGAKPSVRWEKIDGVIYPVSANDYLHTLNLPPGLVRVALIHPHPNLDSAVADDYVGLSQAMEHLRHLGHQRIAFLTLEMQPHATSAQRIPAYRDALRSWGVEPEAAWMRCLEDPVKTGHAWEQIGYDDMRRWLDEDWNNLGCTAILVHNDETAIGVIAALQEAGLRVPEDVSVVGFDGTEIARYHRPRLTTVKVPLEEIGTRGFELLMQQINRPLSEIGQERPRARLSLSTQLQVGQSTAPPPRNIRKSRKI